MINFRLAAIQHSTVLYRIRPKIRVAKMAWPTISSCQDQLLGPAVRNSCQDQMSGPAVRTSCQDQLSGLAVRTSCQDQLSAFSQLSCVFRGAACSSLMRLTPSQLFSPGSDLVELREWEARRNTGGGCSRCSRVQKKCGARYEKNR